MSKTFGFLSKRWFQIFAIGVILFFAAEQTLQHTGNVNLVPTVILLGALTIPAAFVAFFYDQERKHDQSLHKKSPFDIVTICFIVGGVIGTIAAGFLEYQFILNASVSGLFFISVIEEAAKLVFPVILYLFAAYRSESDGLLFGVASGMGFAALETMGYGLVSLLNSQGNIGTLQQVLLVRGLLSPLGHAAWTGIVCAALWYGREKSGKLFNYNVIWVFLVVVALHGFWDMASAAANATVTYVSYVALGAISLILLVLRWRQSRKRLAVTK